MNFKPLHDRVVIKPIEQEEKTTGGIIIPDTAKEKPVKGQVVAVGSGALDQNNNSVPMTVKKDDVVLYPKWSGTEIKIDGKNMLIMKESDIFGIVG